MSSDHTSIPEKRKPPARPFAAESWPGESTSGRILSACDGHGAIRYITPAVESKLGVTQHIYKATWQQLVHPDDALFLPLLLSDLHDDIGRPAAYRIRIRDRAGTYVRHAVATEHIPLANGTFITVSLTAEPDRTRRDVRPFPAIIAVDAEGIVQGWDTHLARLIGSGTRLVTGMSIDRIIVHDGDGHPRAVRLQDSWQGARLVRTHDGPVFCTIQITALAPADDGVAFVICVTPPDHLVPPMTRTPAPEQQDSLTSVWSRPALFDALPGMITRAHAAGGHVAAIALDIDQFATINESIGHAIGDAIIRSLATRLHFATPADGIVARVGSDEFVLIVPASSEHDDTVIDLAREIQRVVARPFAIGGQHMLLTASLGIAFSEPGGSDALLQHANIALARVKTTGPGAVLTYDHGAMTHRPPSQRVRQDLRGAIARDELTLHFQPILNLTTMRAGSVEALVRWNHPELGLVSPAAFMPLVSEFGLHAQLARWGMSHGVAAIQQLESASGPFSSHPVPFPREETRDGVALGIAINVSSRQFANSSLVDDVAELLERTGLAPMRLTIEITEDVLMLDAAAAVTALTSLREMGVHLMIDDFGTGYSSLARLVELPVHGIKLDQMLVQGLDRHPRAAIVVQYAITLAHALELHVTGEGIETDEQLRLLRDMGCDYGQGFLLMRPTDDLEAIAQLAR